MPKLFKRFFIVALLFSQVSVYAQTNHPHAEEMKMYEDTLRGLAHHILRDSIDEARFLATKLFVPTLVKALKTENSFSYRFDSLQGVSIQYPADSSFRIFTWQLYVNKEEYKYYGAIQMNSKDLKLIPLQDRSSAVFYPDREVLSADRWYGALYYNMRQVDAPDGTYYLLFGFDAFSYFNRRKLIDVLYFEDGQPKFGKPVFVNEKKKGQINRLILDYTVEASITVNYSEQEEMILYDNLITMGGQYKGQGVTYVPDGSYHGYKLEKDGKWHHVEKVFNQTQETPPGGGLLESRSDGNLGQDSDRGTGAAAVAPKKKKKKRRKRRRKKNKKETP